MKKIILTVCAFLWISTSLIAQDQTIEKSGMKMSRSVDKVTVFSYEVNGIDGKSFDLKSLYGKKIMIVNTASKCGLTPQYEELQKLYNTYKDSNFIIIGFPSNDFSEQEPGSNEEIAAFCKKNYGVTFPMMEKITVKGKEIHPLYEFLTKKKLNNFKDSEVEWNFQKYLIDEKGRVVEVLSPKVSPLDESVIKWITQKKK